MKRYILYTLQAAPLLWLVLVIAVIATSLLYAVLSTAGIPENTSFIISLISLIALIFFCLLLAPFSLFKPAKVVEKPTLTISTDQSQRYLIEQFTRSLEQLTENTTQERKSFLQMQEQLTEQLTRNLEQLAKNTPQDQQGSLQAQAQITKQLTDNVERLTQLLSEQQELFGKKLDQLTEQQKLVEQKLDQLGELQKQSRPAQGDEAGNTGSGAPPTPNSNILREANRTKKISASISQAEKEQQRILAEDEAKLGPRHPKVALDLDNLAAIYLSQDQFEQAEQFYRRALAIREQKFGPDHPETAQSLDNLAALFVLQNQFEGAEQFYRRSLTIREQRPDTDQTSLVETMKNYADLLRQMKREKDARQLEKRASSLQGNNIQQERKSQDL